MLLTYHKLTATRSAYVYSTTASDFEEHLRTIQSLSATIPPASITFDDGHTSQFTHAVPGLEKHRTKAKFFVTASWIATRAGYMNWAQLRELITLGHEVQAHGWSHALLTHCTPDELTEELRRAKRSLEDGLGIQVDSISMPGGRCNKRVLAACSQEGYRCVYTSDPYSTASYTGSLSIVGRAMVRNTIGRSKLITLLESEQKPWSRERIRFRLKQRVRVVLGDKTYHAVWSWMGNSTRNGKSHEDLLEKTE